MSGAELATLIGLGAFHGLNPGMGWLFAVAIGLQERSRRALWRSVPVIALGHAASIATVAVIVGVSGSVLTSRLVAIIGGVSLVGFGLWRLLSRRHFRWVGMKLSPWQLASWSFLMSSVHGAGLMLVPVLVHEPATGHTGGHHHGPGVSEAVSSAFAATVVHSAAMLVVAGLVAVVVYEAVGLRILRSAWVNLDRVWALALVGAGVATLATL